jgi:hypothetical protein
MIKLHKVVKPILFPVILLCSMLFLSFSNEESVNGNPDHNEKCATVEYNNMLMDRYPEFRSNLESFEEQVKSYIFDPDQPTVVIPVVVHVVWNQSVQNISDAQIQSQIAVLNADFRKLNSDTTEIPSAWKGIAADCQLQFCLAQRDPSGNPTNGITRTYTNRTSFGAGDTSIKYTSLGGHDAWNRNKYLNLWVCNLGGGLLGYAQFPGGPAGTDGVVIGYSYFGTTGVVVPPYDLGRTATHEVGHWMNLRHIWGDEPQCYNDDSVADTPLQQVASTGCPMFPETDQCTPNSPGIMFMNYMDYTDDACMMMFTNGQNVRVQATINGIRSSLKSSDGCQPPGGGGQTVLLEAFENNVFPPTDWTLGYTGTLYWSRSNEASGYGNGTASAKYSFYDAPENTVQALFSKQFTPAGSGLNLTFDYAYATYQNEVDSLLVLASSNGGSTYTILAILLGGPNVGTGMVTAPPTTESFVPTAGQWGTKTYTIPPGTNKVGFATISQYGNNLYIDNVKIGSTIGIKNNETNNPEKFILYQNYPNPFNPSTNIKFVIPKASHVSLKIFDLTGREVVKLLDQDMKTGSYNINWNAGHYASGIYFYVLQAEGIVITKKMTLIK